MEEKGTTLQTITYLSEEELSDFMSDVRIRFFKKGRNSRIRIVLFLNAKGQIVKQTRRLMKIGKSEEIVKTKIWLTNQDYVCNINYKITLVISEVLSFMEKELPRISEAELEIMKVLWGKSPQTANEVIERLESKMEWKPKTIRTLINRLVQKEAVSYHQSKGRMYEYYPLISQENFLQVETKSLLKRLYGVSFKPLLVNFLKEEKLSSEDINELKLILDEKSEENQRKGSKK